MKARLLIVEDDEVLRATIGKFFVNDGYEAAFAGDYPEALALLSSSDFDAVFSDIFLGARTGIEVLQAVRDKDPAIPVIIMTGQPSVETASEAVRLGAYDYLCKPVVKDTLLQVTRMAIRHKRLAEEKNRFSSNLDAVFRSVQDALITVDRDFRLLSANPAAKVVCGISEENAGKPFSGFASYCSGLCFETLSESQRQHKPVSTFRIECRNKKKPQQLVSVTAAPLLNNKGLPCGCVMTARDETRLSGLERELEDRRQFHNILGKSVKMQKLYSFLETLAEVQSTVLITGESGTGKELIAEALHHKGARRERPFVRVNCSALSEGLLESELFGHVKGAFTGAIKDRAGRFEQADSGTLFLDEIGDVTPAVQVKLLRVLQEREFERVGDSAPVKVDVRLIAATNKDLCKKVSAGEFREDLYFRLKVVELHMPPLRQRKEDIPLLIAHFLNNFSKEFNRDFQGVSAEVEKLFMDYYWPGNVRELKHVLERACIVCRQPVITVDDLPPELTAEDEDDGKDRELILQTLEKTGWNISKTARLLGMSRPTVYKRISSIKADIET